MDGSVRRCSALAGGLVSFFFFNDTATTEIYTLSLHDALPICIKSEGVRALVKWFFRIIGLLVLLLLGAVAWWYRTEQQQRSEEHTSELQSRSDLVCRLLLEKKKVLSSLFVSPKPKFTQSRPI